MRKFDPWPVFFNFAITGTIITKFSLGLTKEDAKNSPFVQRHKRSFFLLILNYFFYYKNPIQRSKLVLHAVIIILICHM
ncbi:hypothetical protein UlMin_012524 [Ulmus minor]